jgi:hypothetical protein
MGDAIQLNGECARDQQAVAVFQATGRRAPRDLDAQALSLDREIESSARCDAEQPADLGGYHDLASIRYGGGRHLGPLAR